MKNTSETIAEGPVARQPALVHPRRVGLPCHLRVDERQVEQSIHWWILQALLPTLPPRPGPHNRQAKGSRCPEDSFAQWREVAKLGMKRNGRKLKR